MLVTVLHGAIVISASRTTILKGKGSQVFQDNINTAVLSISRQTSI